MISLNTICIHVHCMVVYMRDSVIVYVHKDLMLVYCFNMVLQSFSESLQMVSCKLLIPTS